ncbi:hypothetical protein SeMB42_g01672 [Synchytrium endobioticum]|uniref:Uncharacterized protein n=1 Tax=Synchytrium endobioticum TaxID=286115 RepID=A0A507DMF2_9FUNG|nr:hypothetical protein SeMB42_g01672 [Synchytrium endobioticum]
MRPKLFPSLPTFLHNLQSPQQTNTATMPCKCGSNCSCTTSKLDANVHRVNVNAPLNLDVVVNPVLPVTGNEIVAATAWLVMHVIALKDIVTATR